MTKPKRTQSIILALLLAVALLVTGCDWSRLNPANLFRSNKQAEGVVRPETAGRMTRAELLQTLLLTLNNQIPVSAAFDSIPDRQKDGLTATEFSQYITALRRSVSGTITSFSVLSAEDGAKNAAEIADQSPAIAALARSSSYYKLSYRDQIGRNSDFIVAIQIDADNLPFLSREWVLRINRLFDFMQLYFAAIETGDEPALAGLLKLGETSMLTAGLVEALNAKSVRTIEYYAERVTTRLHDISPRSLLPSAAVVEQYAKVGGIEGRQQESRTVQFLETSGTIVVVDRVPETIAEDDFKILHDDKLLFKLGSSENAAESAVMEQALGLPLAHDDTNCKTNISGLKNFEFRYPGLFLSGEGTCDNHKNWQGIVYGASLAYSRFSLGSGLKVGQPVSELYKRYPFARENNYQLNGTVGSHTFSLVVQIEQGYITKLSITRVG